MKRINELYKLFILFLIGGNIYCLIELLYRQRTHWSMFLLGGLCFIAIDCLNEYIEWDLSLIIQDIIGTNIITIGEFIFGCIFNLWLKLNVWDYSNIPFNLLGQICLPFCLVWAFIALIAIFVSDYLRFWLFGEEKPHYKLF